MTLSADAQQLIRTTLQSAPRGERTTTADQLAERFGVSRGTIYRIARLGGAARPRATRTDYRAWVATATQIAHRSPNTPVALDLAIEAGIATGELPAEAAAMPLGTAHRLRRELGLTRTDARTQRMDADYPMQALQIDGSTSAHLTVVGRTEDGGDWLLKLHRKPTPASGYKNKPVGPDRTRVTAYGVWDMCTGYTLHRYHVEPGESSLGALDFLLWAMGGDKDPRLVMHGLPDDLWSDQGPLFKSLASTDLLARLGIHLSLGAPYAKTRQGGIERSWRTTWRRFEPTLFLRGEETITLSEANARLAEFWISENARRASRTPVIAGQRASRTEAWTALTNSRAADNRLRACPPDALATLAREAPRKIDANGVLRWHNVEYEVPGLHNAWVTARQSVTDPDVVVCEAADGTRVEARPLVRRAYGEIRGVPATPIEQMLNAAPETTPGADLYAPAAPASGNVRSMPARISAAAAIDNPLETGVHADLDAAMAAFAAHYPHPLSAADHAAVAAHIESAGLERQVVIELAARLLGALAQPPNTGP